MGVVSTLSRGRDTSRKELFERVKVSQPGKAVGDFSLFARDFSQVNTLEPITTAKTRGSFRQFETTLAGSGGVLLEKRTTAFAQRKGQEASDIFRGSSSLSSAGNFLNSFNNPSQKGNDGVQKTNKKGNSKDKPQSFFPDAAHRNTKESNILKGFGKFALVTGQQFGGEGTRLK